MVASKVAKGAKTRNMACSQIAFGSLQLCKGEKQMGPLFLQAVFLLEQATAHLRKSTTMLRWSERMLRWSAYMPGRLHRC